MGKKKKIPGQKKAESESLSLAEFTKKAPAPTTNQSENA